MTSLAFYYTTDWRCACGWVDHLEVILTYSANSNIWANITESYIALWGAFCCWCSNFIASLAHWAGC